MSREVQIIPKPVEDGLQYTELDRFPSKSTNSDQGLQKLQYPRNEELQYPPNEELQYPPNEELQYPPNEELQYPPNEELQYPPNEELQYSPNPETENPQHDSVSDRSAMTVNDQLLQEHITSNELSSAGISDQYEIALRKFLRHSTAPQIPVIKDSSVNGDEKNFRYSRKIFRPSTERTLEDVIKNLKYFSTTSSQQHSTNYSLSDTENEAENRHLRINGNPDTILDPSNWYFSSKDLFSYFHPDITEENIHLLSRNHPQIYSSGVPSYPYLHHSFLIPNSQDLLPSTIQTQSALSSYSNKNKVLTMIPRPPVVNSVPIVPEPTARPFILQRSRPVQAVTPPPSLIPHRRKLTSPQQNSISIPTNEADSFSRQAELTLSSERSQKSIPVYTPHNYDLQLVNESQFQISQIPNELSPPPSSVLHNQYRKMSPVHVSYFRPIAFPDISASFPDFLDKPPIHSNPFFPTQRLIESNKADSSLDEIKQNATGQFATNNNDLVTVPLYSASDTEFIQGARNSRRKIRLRKGKRRQRPFKRGPIIRGSLNMRTPSPRKRAYDEFSSQMFSPLDFEPNKTKTTEPSSTDSSTDSPKFQKDSSSISPSRDKNSSHSIYTRTHLTSPTASFAAGNTEKSTYHEAHVSNRNTLIEADLKSPDLLRQNTILTPADQGQIITTPLTSPTTESSSRNEISLTTMALAASYFRNGRKTEFLPRLQFPFPEEFKSGQPFLIEGHEDFGPYVLARAFF